MTLVNKNTGIEIEISDNFMLWTIFFGPFYFISHGIWTHGLICGILFLAGGFLGNILYSPFAKEIVLNYYRKKGWMRVN